jgi:hypothetical protein
MLIALMGVEEHKHALIPKVALAESLFVQAVDLRVSEDVAHTLKINDHHVTLGELPREVTQSLSDQALIGIFSCGVSPTGIVIVLVVLAFNEVLSIVVFEWGSFIQNLIDERVYELNHVARADERDHLIIEFIDNVRTDEHGLDIIFHLLRMICSRVDVLRDLHHVLLIQLLVLH